MKTKIPVSGFENLSCLRSSGKFTQSVMIWGARSSAGFGALCFSRSKVSHLQGDYRTSCFGLVTSNMEMWILYPFIRLASKLAWHMPLKEEHVRCKSHSSKATWASRTPQQCHRPDTSQSHQVAAVIHATKCTKHWVLYMVMLISSPKCWHGCNGWHCCFTAKKLLGPGAFLCAVPVSAWVLMGFLLCICWWQSGNSKLSLGV